MAQHIPLEKFQFEGLANPVQEIFLSQDRDGNAIQVMASNGFLGVSVHGDAVGMLEPEDAVVLHAALGEWIASHKSA